MFVPIYIALSLFNTFILGTLQFTLHTILMETAPASWFFELYEGTPFFQEYQLSLGSYFSFLTSPNIVIILLFSFIATYVVLTLPMQKIHIQEP